MPTEKNVLLPNLGIQANIAVGIFEREGARGHGDGETVAQVAAYHEFGLGVPTRSFLRAYFDENADRLGAMLEKAVGDAIVEGTDLKSSLDRIAAQIEGEVKERLYAGIEPGLAPSTLAKRPGGIPLIDSGVLLSSIRSEIGLIVNEF